MGVYFTVGIYMPDNKHYVKKTNLAAKGFNFKEENDRTMINFNGSC